jgi:hypothetical protein
MELAVVLLFIIGAVVAGIFWGKQTSRNLS